MPHDVPLIRQHRRVVEFNPSQGAPLHPEGFGGRKRGLVQSRKARGMSHSDVDLDDCKRVIFLELFDCIQRGQMSAAVAVVVVAP